MQQKDLFEYAVIRIVPRVEREEFLNAGVVVYCAKQSFLKILFRLDKKRLNTLCIECDAEDVTEYLQAFQRICNADKEGGPIAKLPASERFRWLTATRSTIVQTSKVHPGFCEDANEMLKKLFTDLVN